MCLLRLSNPGVVATRRHWVRKFNNQQTFKTEASVHSNTYLKESFCSVADFKILTDMSWMKWGWLRSTMEEFKMSVDIHVSALSLQVTRDHQTPESPAPPPPHWILISRDDHYCQFCQIDDHYCPVTRSGSDQLSPVHLALIKYFLISLLTAPPSPAQLPIAATSDDWRQMSRPDMKCRASSISTVNQARFAKYSDFNDETLTPASN